MTVSSKRLGQRLRELREACRPKLTVQVVADLMGCSKSKISRQESGLHVVATHELSHLVTRIYGGSEETLAALEYLRQRSLEPPGWWIESGGEHLKEHFAAYLALEADAVEVRTVALEVIPGLLQSESYVWHQVNMALHVEQSVRERYAAIRLRRQERLTSKTNPLVLEAVISESALLRAGCGSEQLAGLIGRAQLPNVTVRILPIESGPHRAAGAFTILTLPAGTLPPVVYQPNIVGGNLIEHPESVQRITEVYEDIRTHTLSAEDSIRLLRKIGQQA